MEKLISPLRKITLPLVILTILIYAFEAIVYAYAFSFWDTNVWIRILNMYLLQVVLVVSMLNILIGVVGFMVYRNEIAQKDAAKSLLLKYGVLLLFVFMSLYAIPNTRFCCGV